MSKISRIIERIDKLVVAYERCNESESCNGCPYDGVCSTKAFALENDASDVLCDVLGILNDGNHKAVCDDIRGTYLMICNWIKDMKCGRFIEDDDIEGGILCMTPEMELDLVAMLKQLKEMLTKMK